MAAAPAGAQTVGTLVSNVDEGGIGSPRNYAAQSFRTGGQAGGYEITEIRIFGARSANPPTEPLLKIRDDDGGEPGDLVATLSNPSHFNTDEAIFRAPSGTMLDANTTYWVMINDGVTGMRINYSLTSGNGQTGQPGWSIGDTHLRRLSEVNEWATDDSDSVRVHIRGPVTAAPIESGSDATLRDLRVRTFTDFYSLRPAFDPDTSSYLVSVPENVGTFYVAPTPSDSGASVRVSPGSRFNSELWTVSVSNGSNYVNVIVTAVDGTEKRYRLNLRARNPRLTHDARLPPGSRLRFLALSAAAEVVELPGEEVPGEDCGCATYYQVVVPRDVSRLQVAAMAHGGARVETQFRTERRRSDADGVRTVSLREGRNEMIFFVYRTGNNPGRALEVYRVMIIRAGRPPKLKDATVTRDGHVLLHYDRTLHPSGPGTPGSTSTPGSAFEVTVDGVEVEVTYTAVTERWLRLNLARGAGPDAQVRVRYRVPSTNPVQSSSFGRAEAFSNKVARYAGSGLTVFDTTAGEAPGATADFKVLLLPAPVARVTVDYATSDGTATAGADYTATSGTLTFGVGEEHKTISVPVADDDFEDGGETFTLTLSNPVNAFLGDAIATGTITNDDPALLTGSFVGAPETHGSKPFDLELEFTEPVGVGWEALRDEVLSVTNGRVTRASRVDKTRDPLTNQWLTAYWQITVEPSGGDVTVELPATADCGARLAVCTSDGRPLSARVVVTVAEGVLPPELLTATVNAAEVTLTWDEALDEASVPGASAFTVRVGGAARGLAASGPVTVSGSTVTLTLASPVDHGETVTVDYTAPSASPLRNLAGGAAAALDGQPVTNRTPDTTGPALVAAAASWDAVVLTWDEALDEASVPGASAFTVRVGGAAWELADERPGDGERVDGDAEVRVAGRAGRDGDGGLRGAVGGPAAGPRGRGRGRGDGRDRGPGEGVHGALRGRRRPRDARRGGPGGVPDRVQRRAGEGRGSAGERGGEEGVGDAARGRAHLSERDREARQEQPAALADQGAVHGRLCRLGDQGPDHRVGADAGLCRRGRAVHRGREEALEPDLDTRQVPAVAVGGRRAGNRGGRGDDRLHRDPEPCGVEKSDGGLCDIGRDGDERHRLHGVVGHAHLRPGGDRAHGVRGGARRRRCRGAGDADAGAFERLGRVAEG